MTQIVQVNDIQKVDGMEEIVDAIPRGTPRFFIDGEPRRLSQHQRAIRYVNREPDSERKLRGPGKAFRNR